MPETATSVYRARADWWVLALLATSGILLIALAFGLVAAQVRANDPWGLYVAVGAMFVVGVWVPAIPFLLRYELRDDSLRILLFPFRLTVPYRSIRAVRADGRPCWAAINFALSVRYVLIEYDGLFGLGRMMPLAISPQSPDHFVADLRQRWQRVDAKGVDEP